MGLRSMRKIIRRNGDLHAEYRLRPGRRRIERPFISRHPRIHLFSWFLAWKEAFTPHRKAYD